MADNLAYQYALREELIDGKLVAMSPSPAWNHVAIAGNLYFIFKTFLKGKKYTPIPDGFDLHLTKDNILVPDMMVVCDRSKIKSNGVHGAPDLVVEILSPSTAKNDRGRKKELYAEYGVKEYWIVSPFDKAIEVYQNKDGEFVLHDVYTVYEDWMLEQLKDEERSEVKTHIKCSLFDDLDISLEEIFSDC